MTSVKTSARACERHYPERRHFRVPGELGYAPLGYPEHEENNTDHQNERIQNNLAKEPKPSQGVTSSVVTHPAGGMDSQGHGDPNADPNDNYFLADGVITGHVILGARGWRMTELTHQVSWRRGVGFQPMLQTR